MEQLRKYTNKHGYTLPDDWSVRNVKRERGASRGQVDHYYFTPGGKRFRSKVEVLKFLRQSDTHETEPKDITPDDCSYIYILTNPVSKKNFIKIGMCTSINSHLQILNSSIYKKFKVHTLFDTIFKNKISGKKITKQIETYLHKRFNHLRVNTGELFLVDPCIVRDELKFIHDKVAPYADLDANMTGEYMELHIELARLQSAEDQIMTEISLTDLKLNLPEPTITRHHDGRSSRPLCRDPYNEKHSKYDIPCSQHVCDCKCPYHRGKSFWRRLTGSARDDRDRQMKKGEKYMKSIVGLSCEEYKGFLMDDFRVTFSGILPDQVLGKTYPELRNDLFVIDEIFPRCEGKHLNNPSEIALFLAKVFNYRNTQLIIHNNVEARKHGVDVKKYKRLINGTKIGIVYAGAKENFDKIEPDQEAVSYMLTFVKNFMKGEPTT